jgi:hypothetical protein
MKIIGFSERSTVLKGMPDTATRNTAEARSVAKLIMFLHKKEQAI